MQSLPDRVGCWARFDDRRRSSPCRCFVDNWRWAGVPFFMRTGKRLPTRASSISVVLKSAAADPVQRQSGAAAGAERADDQHSARRGILARHLVRRCRDRASRSGRSRWTSTTARPSATASPEAYERLLLRRDHRRRHALHAPRRRRGVVALDHADTGALEGNDRQPLPTYPAGSWGPAAADRLVESSGDRWREP